MTNTKSISNKENRMYVSQKAILFDEKGRILTIRRSKTAPSRPLFWDLPGGDIEIGEDLISGITREIKEETKLEIKKPIIIDAIAEFNERKEYWITICYMVKSISTKVVLSFEHDDYKWLIPEEFLKLKVSSK